MMVHSYLLAKNINTARLKFESLEEYFAIGAWFGSRSGSNIVFNAEDTDALGLESDDGIFILVLRECDGARTCNGVPVKFVLDHLVIVLIVSQGALSDLDIQTWLGSRGCRFRVISLEKIFGILANVEHRGLFRSAIKQVSKILKTDDNLVFVHGQKVDFEITIKVLNRSLRISS